LDNVCYTEFTPFVLLFSLRVSLELLALTAVSPLDGRYGRQTAELREVFSEFAFMRERLRVEVEWLIGLSSLGLPELAIRCPRRSRPNLRQLVVHFSIEDCTEIKAIEAETNHDVKAVEYFIKARTGAALGPAAEFIHFACTSEDINNVSHALMLERGRFVLQGRLRAIHAQLREYAYLHADLPMLSRTHGQTATPTTVGKEFANVAVRLGGADRCHCTGAAAREDERCGRQFQRAPGGLPGHRLGALRARA
jgi:adenylosuccinate lyase